MSDEQATTIRIQPEILKEMRIEQVSRGLRNLGDLIEELWRAYKSAMQPEEETPHIQPEEAKKAAQKAQETREDTLEQKRQRYIELIPAILKDPGSYNPREILHAAETVKDQDPGTAIVLMALYKERVIDEERKVK